MKRVTVRYEVKMDLPDSAELVVTSGESGGTDVLQLNGRLFAPFELVWEEWNVNGTPGSVVEDDDLEAALRPEGSVWTYEMLMEPSE